MKKPGKDEKDPKKSSHQGKGSEEKKENSAVPMDASDVNEGSSVAEEENPYEKEICELKDRYMRLFAEYDNFRKRTQKEREGLYEDAVTEVVKDWLPVIDTFERGLAFLSQQKLVDKDSQSEGLEMVYRQAREVMVKFGVEEIPCTTGTEFDPNLHAAVAHIEDADLGEQCVAQVFQKGYRKGDKILRHTMVQVAN